MKRARLTCTVVLGWVAALGSTPAAASSDTSALGWKAIAVGDAHSLGVKTDGSVWAWGENDGGELGFDSKALPKSLVPVKVEGLSQVASVAAGENHSLALKTDGTVWIWGSVPDGKVNSMEARILTVPTQVQIDDVVQIAADWRLSYALKRDGSVWPWGYMQHTLEDGSIQVATEPFYSIAGLEDIVDISSGYGGFMALREDGAVWTFSEALGTVQIDGIRDIVDLAVGWEHTYGVKSDGSVWVWGKGGLGLDEVADPNAVRPRLLEGAESGFVEVEATAAGPLLRKNDGTVWASGDNIAGQLGLYSYDKKEGLVQTKARHAIDIAASGIGYRSMAIRADGTLWSWGYGYSGNGREAWAFGPVWVPSHPDEEPNDDEIFVRLNGKPLYFVKSPYFADQRVLVPMRAIFEAIGAQVEWNEATGEITSRWQGSMVVLKQGQVTLRNGTSYVPLRLVAESLGAQVNWIGEEKTVEINIASDGN